MYNALRIDPKTTETVVQLRDRIAAVPAYLCSYNDQFRLAKDLFDAVFSLGSYNFSDNVTTLYWECFAYPEKIAGQMPRSVERLEDGRKRQLALLAIDIRYFQDTLTAYRQELDVFVKTPLTVDAMRSMPTKLKSLRDRVETLQKLAESMRSKETVLNGEPPLNEQWSTFLHDVGANEQLWQIYEKYSDHHRRWVEEYYANADPESIRAALTR